MLTKGGEKGDGGKQRRRVRVGGGEDGAWVAEARRHTTVWDKTSVVSPFPQALGAASA